MLPETSRHGLNRRLPWLLSERIAYVFDRAHAEVSSNSLIRLIDLICLKGGHYMPTLSHVKRVYLF